MFVSRGGVMDSTTFIATRYGDSDLFVMSGSKRKESNERKTCLESFN